MARFQRKRRIAEVVGRQSLEHNGSTGTRIHTAGKAHELPDVYGLKLRIGPARHCVSNTVAHFDFLNALPNSGNGSSGFRAGHQGRVDPIQPGPMVHVYKIDPDRLDSNNRLSRLRFGFRNIFVAKDLRSSVLVHTNRFHNAVTLG